MTALAFSGKTNILDLYRMIECGPNVDIKYKVLKTAVCNQGSLILFNVVILKNKNFQSDILWKLLLISVI
jgi:hypothetical protein